MTGYQEVHDWVITTSIATPVWPKRGGRRGESLHEAMMRLFRVLFEPWERHPAMLVAYFRARSGPSGLRLLRRGLDAVVPTALDVLAGVDEEFIADMDAVIANVVYGLLGRFAAGEIPITDILPTLDRALLRLTAGYETVHRS